MGNLKPIGLTQVPNDAYYVTVRGNEGDIEENGLIYLHGTHNRVRIDLVNADYFQTLDLASAGESHSLHPDYPEVIYWVENSSLITNINLSMQETLTRTASEAQERYRHYKIILDKLIIDLVRYNDANLPPIVKVEEVDNGKSD